MLRADPRNAPFYRRGSNSAHIGAAQAFSRCAPRQTTPGFRPGPNRVERVRLRNTILKPDSTHLPALLDLLEAQHGKPARALPRTALEWVLWENAAYLVPDAKRRAAYVALEKRTGLSADGILGVPREDLQTLAKLGGMLAELRVRKWIDIAETVRDVFEGDLERALELPLPKARAALKKFPGIGAPGADRILLFTGAHAIPALESNGLRVLVRLGLATEAKNYGATYRSCMEALAPHTGLGGPWLMRAFDLLRTHGKALCKQNGPNCDECALEEACPFAS